MQYIFTKRKQKKQFAFKMVLLVAINSSDMAYFGVCFFRRVCSGEICVNV